MWNHYASLLVHNAGVDKLQKFYQASDAICLDYNLSPAANPARQAILDTGKALIHKFIKNDQPYGSCKERVNFLYAYVMHSQPNKNNLFKSSKHRPMGIVSMNLFGEDVGEVHGDMVVLERLIVAASFC